MALDLTDPALAPALAHAAQANCVVELTLDGTVLTASDSFLTLVGLPGPQVAGRHLSQVFASTDGAEVGGSFARVARGECVQFEPRHATHDGRLLVLHVTLAPVFGADARAERVLALLTDVSEVHREAAIQADLVKALSASQAVIEFTPQGEIVTANQNFLDALGYRLEELKGRHHRMFVDPAEAHSPAYSGFWEALRRGESQTGEYRRVGKGGNAVYIVATYAAVPDATGKVSRVVKFATDVTERKVAVDALVSGIGRMAEGDLTARIDRQLTGEFARVREVFNASVAAFGNLVDEVRGRSDAMNGEAGAIARGADDLARRGESQAASLEQTAAAVEQISGNVTTTSQSARDADDSARAAQDIVMNGAEIVNSAIAAMERIDGHTRSMGEFTRVIENFAFQTNLLSINAAVEAARAGEVGRGFAVVANEVRNLAQQSAKASQSIAGLIGQSEAEVTTGVRLVKDAGTALDQIRTAVTAMARNIAGIAHATTEQATGVREVSEALSQLDSVNQSNLALSDQNATAASALSTQVTEMTTLMARFRTQANNAAAGAPRPRHAA